jgi:hypothetical protein
MRAGWRRVCVKVVAKDNTTSTVWADRAKTNAAWLERNGLTSAIHRRKPRGRPMPDRMARVGDAGRAAGTFVS